MSQKYYYIRNWGKICYWLALYCLVELIFNSIAFIPKAILFGILLTNNRKFLYILRDSDEDYKIYFRAVKTSCILLGIGAFFTLIMGFLSAMIPSPYYWSYLGINEWQNWLYEYREIIQFLTETVSFGFAISSLILEIIAWYHLRAVFKQNSLNASQYHKDNLVRATKFLFWGSLWFALCYCASYVNEIWNILTSNYSYLYGYYGFIPFYSWFLYSLPSLIIRFLSSGALIMVGIAYAIMGSNLKNPFFTGENLEQYRNVPVTPRFGISVENGINRREGNSRNYCLYCGSKLRKEGKFCPNCGKTFP